MVSLLKPSTLQVSASKYIDYIGIFTYHCANNLWWHTFAMQLLQLELVHGPVAVQIPCQNHRALLVHYFFCLQGYEILDLSDLLAADFVRRCHHFKVTRHV